MVKVQEMTAKRFFGMLLASTICLPLAGCLSAGDPWGEGSMAYTVDDNYPIAERKPCGTDWPNLAYDTSNHMAPNHGCAVHANISAMVANKKVLRRPLILDPTPASTAVGALNIYEAYSGAAVAAQTYGGAGAGASNGSKP